MPDLAIGFRIEVRVYPPLVQRLSALGAERVILTAAADAHHHPGELRVGIKALAAPCAADAATVKADRDPIALPMSKPSQLDP